MSLLDSILSGMDATYKKKKIASANEDPIRQIQLAAAEQKKKALSEWRQSVRQKMDGLLKDTIIHHIVFSPQDEDSKRFIIDEEAQDLDLVSIKINDSTAASNLAAHLRSTSQVSSTIPLDDEKSRVGIVGSIVVFKKGYEPNLESPAPTEPEAQVNVDKDLSQARKPTALKVRVSRRKKTPALPTHGADNLIVLGTNKRDLRSIEQKMLDMKKRKKNEGEQGGKQGKKSKKRGK